jgi:hypothetical protein
MAEAVKGSNIKVIGVSHQYGQKEKGEWEVWGNTNCAKGEPVQVVHPGHGAAQVRFRNVKVGVGE